MKQNQNDIPIDLDSPLLPPGAREYIQQKLDRYGLIENMPDNVRETIEAFGVLTGNK